MTASDRNDITRALNRIDQFAPLGRVPLAHAPAIDAAIGGTQDTPTTRGRTLSRLLHTVIRAEAERRFEGRETRDVAEWSILYLRVEERRTIAEIAATLNMPVRSVGRYYARAKDLLFEHILDHPTTGSADQLHCPLCGAGLPTPAPSTPNNAICGGCGAAVTVEWRAKHTIAIVARKQ